MGQVVRLEDLQRSLYAIKKYKRVLEENFDILKRSEEICEKALQNNDLSSRYIAQLDESLKYLFETITLAKEAEISVRKTIELYLSV